MNKAGNFSILIVDDNPHNLQVLSGVLDGCDYEIGLAMSGNEAIDYVKIEKPDLILLDVMMPEMNGYETCKFFKSKSDFSDIPIIFLTAKTEIEDIVKGFEVGGVDYIAKPFNSAELKSRVKTHLDLKKTRDDLKNSYESLVEAKKVIEIQNNKLSEAMVQLEILSNVDALTEIANRRSMLKAIRDQQLQLQGDETFSIVMADIDHFKIINDTYGHDAGDEVLKTIASIIQLSIRQNDYISRWGGEEFLVMFTSISIEKATALTERIRNSINSHVFMIAGKENTVTLTFGISDYHVGDSIDRVIKRADDALYKGKNSGRNKVVVG